MTGASEVALRRGAAGLGLDISASDAARLLLHVAEVRRWNRVADLVSDAAEADIADHHILDSLALLRLLPVEREEIVDVGAGGGFPSIPLAVVRPGLKLTLVEQAHRKVVFLRQAASDLGLPGVRVVGRRIEEAGLSGRFDVALSRATFPPLRWIEEGAALVRQGGAVVLMAARQPETDLLARSRDMGLAVEREDAFSLPLSGAPRVNTLFRKL